jgi:hypothetical protein
MDLAAVLAWAAARAAHWLARVFRSIGCRCNAWIGRQFSGVVRGRRRALRRTGPRPPARVSGFRIKRGHCGSSWLRRSGGLRLLPFVVRGAAHRRSTGRWTIHRTPLLRFWSPAALACHVACLCAGRRHLSGHPASTVGLRRPSSFALVIACVRVRWIVRSAHTEPRARHRAPTHRFDAGCPCGFSLGGDGPVDFARIDAARFGWDAPPFSSCAAASHARRAHHGSCAGAVLLSRRSATRGWGHVAWSGPFSASRSLLGFPSRELGRQRGRPVVTRVTVSLSTPFARRRSWGFPDCPFAGLLPQTGGRRVSARPDPRAVGRSIGRGVLAVRSAGPVEAVGRLVAFVFARPRCYAPPL